MSGVLSEQAQGIDHQVSREEQVELAEPEELAVMALHGSLGGKTVQRALQEPPRADGRALSCSCCEAQCPFTGLPVCSEQGEKGKWKAA